MRVLVSGGSGFIGRHIVEGLAARQEVDAVVHTAVKPGHRNAPDLAALCDANLRQFFSLVRGRAAFRRFMVLTSGAVYGVQRPSASVSEDTLGRAADGAPDTPSSYATAIRHLSTPSECRESPSATALPGTTQSRQVLFCSAQHSL